MAASPAKLRRLMAEETGGVSFRLGLAHFWMRLLPIGAAGRVRAALYRLAGLSIGPGAIIAGPIAFGKPDQARKNVRIGARCFINSHVFVDAGGPIMLGEGVSVGHHSVLITTDHAIGPASFRAGTASVAPITIGDGAWLAAGVTVLPGVSVGAGAVVAAGAVVTKDVPPNTLVGGIPAKAIRVLEE